MLSHIPLREGMYERRQWKQRLYMLGKEPRLNPALLSVYPSERLRIVVVAKHVVHPLVPLPLNFALVYLFSSF